MWPRVVAWGLAYFVIGMGSAALSRGAASGEMKQVWRLAAWALSLGVFAASFGDERSRCGGAPLKTAFRAALPVALGGFLLAVAATVHALSVGTFRPGAYGLALVAWPAMLGVASFLVAWAAAAVLPKRKTG
jgi:hypothetical protein